MTRAADFRTERSIRPLTDTRRRDAALLRLVAELRSKGEAPARYELLRGAPEGTQLHAIRVSDADGDELAVLFADVVNGEVRMHAVVQLPRGEAHG